MGVKIIVLQAVFIPSDNFFFEVIFISFCLCIFFLVKNFDHCGKQDFLPLLAHTMPTGTPVRREREREREGGRQTERVDR